MNADELRTEAQRKKEKTFRAITRRNVLEIQQEQQLIYIIIIAILFIIGSSF